jgi:hypothetical protein
MIFRLRLWASDALFSLALWVMPEHRVFAHRQGERINYERRPG